MRTFTLRAVLAASMLLIAPLSASAGEATYTAEEAAELFTRSADLGPERGICVGTVEECATAIIEAETFDLLVMGAYSHSRLRSLFLGSTTTEMIRSCKVPVVIFR